MYQHPHQYGVRSDVGGARPSVQALIAELENGMRVRGGNYMGITGMNLAVVRTLLNHIDRLEDRVDYLEGLLLPSQAPAAAAQEAPQEARE